MPTIFSRVSERRSPAAGGHVLAVFWVMNVDAPPAMTSLSFICTSVFDGEARLGESGAPEMDGLSDATALPANCGRTPWAVVELTVLGKTSLLVRPLLSMLCQSFELKRMSTISKVQSHTEAQDLLCTVRPKVRIVCRLGLTGDL